VQQCGVQQCGTRRLGVLAGSGVQRRGVWGAACSSAAGGGAVRGAERSGRDVAWDSTK